MHLLSPRDIAVAALTAALTTGVLAARQTPAPAPPATMMRSTVFDWTAMKDTATDVGSVRNVVRAPTPTLDELEMHITTLKPGLESHPPHQHPTEELIVIREGTVETLSQGVWKRLGPGSVIFNASNELHGLRNVGTTPAVYHVINWKTEKTK